MSHVELTAEGGHWMMADEHPELSLDRGPEESPVGRVAVVRDPFGHRWFLNQPTG